VNIMDTLDQILLTKLSYDSGISENTLMKSDKFREEWAEFCQSTDYDFTLENVLDYVFELQFDGEFEIKF
jgi:hypothetical protein